MFLNCGADGLVDIVAMDADGAFRKFDVKTYNLVHSAGRPMSNKQADIGVEHIWFEPVTRCLGFTKDEVRNKISSLRQGYNED